MDFVVARNPDPDSRLRDLARLPIDGRVRVRCPEIPIVFLEARPLADEWTFRYLGALAEHESEPSAEHAAARARPTRRETGGRRGRNGT